MENAAYIPQAKKKVLFVSSMHHSDFTDPDIISISIYLISLGENTVIV